MPTPTDTVSIDALAAASAPIGAAKVHVLQAGVSRSVDLDDIAALAVHPASIAPVAGRTNTEVALFDSTGAALQGSGVTIAAGELATLAGDLTLAPASGLTRVTGGLSVVSTLDGLGVPVWTQAQEDAAVALVPATGRVWFNTTSGEFKGWNGSAAVVLDAAGGGGGAPQFQAVRDLSGANHYEAAADNLRGAVAGFSASVLFRMLKLSTTGGGVLFGCFRRFQTDGGWGLGYDNSRFKLYIAQDSDGAMLENGAGAAFADQGSVLGKLALSTLTYDGSTARLYVQGEEVFSLTPGTMRIAAAIAVPMIGDVDNASFPAVDASVLGAAYGTQVMTPDEVAAHYVDVIEAGAMADDPGTGFASMYSLDGEVAAPATISDSIGAVDLSRVGAPTLESKNTIWL